MELPKVAVVESDTVVWLRDVTRQALESWLLSSHRTVNDSATFPVKPFNPVTVMLNVPVWPGFSGNVVGKAERVKSTTLTVTVVCAVRDPLVPVTLTA